MQGTRAYEYWAQLNIVMLINISMLINVHLLVNGTISSSHDRPIASKESFISEWNKQMNLWLYLRNFPYICLDEQKNPLPRQELRDDNKYFVEDFI